MGGLKRFRLDGKVAVVTGANGGIGRAAIALFQDAGASVAAFDRELGELPSLVGEKGFATVLDVTDMESIVATFATVNERYGHVDVLINNAGIAWRGSSTDVTPAQWDAVLDVNLKGVMFCAQAAGRLMLRQGSGAIVNISSQLAIGVTGERAAYVSSKAGVVGLTKSLAVEWAPRGVRVNCVAPGVTRTPMTAYIDQNEELAASFKAKIPLGRFAEPHEIADACLYLSSDASSYVTGQVIVVDGGFTVQ